MDGAVLSDLQTEREPDEGTAASTAMTFALEERVEGVGGMILVDELVAAAGYAVEIGVGVDEVDVVV